MAGFAIGYALPFRADTFKQARDGAGMRLAIYLIAMALLAALVLR
jgi:hypothetical protein